QAGAPVRRARLPAGGPSRGRVRRGESGPRGGGAGRARGRQRLEGFSQRRLDGPGGSGTAARALGAAAEGLGHRVRNSLFFDGTLAGLRGYNFLQTARVRERSPASSTRPALGVEGRSYFLSSFGHAGMKSGPDGNPAEGRL